MLIWSYISVGFLDEAKSVLLTDGWCADVPALQLTQEEADTRLILHVLYSVQHDEVKRLVSMPMIQIWSSLEYSIACKMQVLLPEVWVRSGPDIDQLSDNTPDCSIIWRNNSSCYPINLQPQWKGHNQLPILHLQEGLALGKLKIGHPSAGRLRRNPRPRSHWWVNETNDAIGSCRSV